MKMTSYLIKKEDYEHLPEYDGNPLEVEFFCTIVNDVLSRVCNVGIKQSDIEYNHNLLLHKILCKLTGQAKMLVITRKVNSIPELLTLLKTNFADRRTYECLKEELRSLKPLPKEEPISFINRIQEIRNLIYIRVRLDYPEQSDADLKFFMSKVDGEAIYHFYNNVPLMLANHVMTFNPTDLDQLRAIVHNNCGFVIKNLNKPRMPSVLPMRQLPQRTNYKPFHSFQQPHASHQQPQTYPQNRPINYKNPRFANKPFGSQNTVSMRTARPEKIDLKRYVSPYELTHIESDEYEDPQQNYEDYSQYPYEEEEYTVDNFYGTNNSYNMSNQQERVDNLEGKIDSLTEKFDHFLGRASLKEKPPDQN